ncbi:MAG: exo-alpha-sialidase [Bryobacterales bacterium]|nr:exo-alpha-sialidase [Bryobacterales bacterium]
MPATRRQLLRAALAAGFSYGVCARASVAAEEIAIWKAGEGGYHTYRIPALLTTKRGTLLAFCEGRRDNSRDHGDIDILVKRSTDGGRTWSPHQIVYEEGGDSKVTIGNPCPVVEERTGTIWLPFNRENDAVLITSSTDDGRTWAKPADITASVKKPGWTWYAAGPGTGIQIRAGRYRGRVVIPCDHREKVDGQDVKMSHVFYSDDRGKTWKLGGTVGLHTDECQVAETAGGNLIINMRNYWERDGKQPEKGGMRAISRSTDGGLTWSPLEFHSQLIEPVCQASLLRHPKPRGGGKLMLFSNPADRQKRVRMTIRQSRDEGRTWPVQKIIHEGPSAYSSLAILPEGHLGILYERGAQSAYESLTFSRLPLEVW